VAAFLALAGQLLLAGCGSVSRPTAGPSEPVEVFAEPPPDFGPQWSFNGTKVDWHVVSTPRDRAIAGCRG